MFVRLLIFGAYGRSVMPVPLGRTCVGEIVFGKTFLLSFGRIAVATQAGPWIR